MGGSRIIIVIVNSHHCDIHPGNHHHTIVALSRIKDNHHDCSHHFDIHPSNHHQLHLNFHLQTPVDNSSDYWAAGWTGGEAGGCKRRERQRRVSSSAAVSTAVRAPGTLYLV